MRKSTIKNKYEMYPFALQRHTINNVNHVKQLTYFLPFLFPFSSHSLLALVYVSPLTFYNMIFSMQVAQESRHK